MKILLDTHIFLWFISGDNKLSADIRDAIRDTDNAVYLSVVSVWESIIKYQLGKLSLPESPEIYFKSLASPLMKGVLLNWLNYHCFTAIHLIES